MTAPQGKPGGKSEIVLYQTEDGRSRIQVRLEKETVWLTQMQLAELFQTTKQNISLHIQSILEDGELSREATVKQYLTVQAEGKRRVRRSLEHYNLDMILAVGYRVRSPRGVQFRQWATERLREYLIKGFTLDDERLKGHDRLADYFDELLARIREIRASEARVYQRIREIFSLANDYVEGQQETQLFFATMQNKMHYAAAGMTAAEIVRRRADAGKSNMGLSSWSGTRVLKRDVTTAKNYLAEKEIDTLNRIVVMFLDQAEFRAQRRQDIKMGDWTAFLDQFLRQTELPVLGELMSSRSAKLRPGPGSMFHLKTKWENWEDVKHFRVYLERRAPGRFGRLEAMYAVVPKRKRLEGADRFFASAKYRLNMLRVAEEVLTNAGVPEEQANSFMAEIQREYPAPTQERLFLEEVESPPVALALGRRQKELSYYKTGVPELTDEDQRLLKDCMEDLGQRMKNDRALALSFLEIGLGPKAR